MDVRSPCRPSSPVLAALAVPDPQATAEMSEQLPALPLHTCARTLLRRSTGHGTTGVSLHALRCADLLVSFMTSSSTSCFIVAVFLYKNKSRNTIEIHIILSRPLDQWPRLEHTPSLFFLLKSPSVFGKLIRGPLRNPQIMPCSFKKRILLG